MRRSLTMLAAGAVLFCAMVLPAPRAFGIETMYLWFDEAYDQNGNLLDKRDTSQSLFSLDPLNFIVRTDTTEIRIHAAYWFFPGVDTTVDFVDAQINHLKGGSQSAYEAAYTDELITLDELNDMRPIDSTYQTMWFYTAHLAYPGVVSGGDVFDLTHGSSYLRTYDTLYPERSRYINFRNDVQWAVVTPEPASIALFGLGLAGLAARKRRK